MQYNGGKARIAKDLASVLRGLTAGKTYWEPFVGAGNVIQHVQAARRFGSDIERHILAFLTAVRDGWLPPDSLSEEDYYFLRDQRGGPASPMVAFAGYGCSFGGKFFGGYARDESRNFAAYAHNTSAKQAPMLINTQFVNEPYWYEPFGHVDVIYCDPPYKNTTRCGSAASFDHVRFWAWAKEKARNSLVLVSEFTAPSFASEIWAASRGALLRRANGEKHTERLFVVSP